MNAARALVAGGDDADALVGERFEEAEEALAGDGECEPDTGGTQGFGDE